MILMFRASQGRHSLSRIVFQTLLFVSTLSDGDVREYIIKVSVGGVLHKVLVVQNVTEKPAVDTALISESALKHCSLHRLESTSASCMEIHNAVIASARGETAEDIAKLDRPQVLEGAPERQTSGTDTPTIEPPLFELDLGEDFRSNMAGVLDDFDGRVAVRDADPPPRPDELARQLCAPCAAASGCDVAHCAAAAQRRLLEASRCARRPRATGERPTTAEVQPHRAHGGILSHSTCG